MRASKQTETGEVDDAGCSIGSVFFCELENMVGDS
jgi:hypothetical protein